MANLNTLVDILKSRVQLKAPEEETDVVYKVQPTVLEEIIIHSVSAHNPAYTVDTLPQEEEPFVLWLAEVEVYFALASGNSRFFSISAQGAEINKQQRVNHYMKLIEGRQRHYDTMWAKFKENNPNQVSTGEIYTFSPNALTRIWRLAERPSIVLQCVAKTPTTADLLWTVKSSLNKYRVSVYKHSDLIVDEWEIPTWSDSTFIPINSNSTWLFSTNDLFINKYRVKGLVPDTLYKVAVVLVDNLGRWTHSEIELITDV